MQSMARTVRVAAVSGDEGTRAANATLRPSAAEGAWATERTMSAPVEHTMYRQENIRTWAHTVESTYSM